MGKATVRRSLPWCAAAKAAEQNLGSALGLALAAAPRLWTHQRLRTLLLPLPLDVELIFLAIKLRRSFAFELVPIDRKGVVDRNRVVLELPHGGEGQFPVLEFHVLKFLIFLVRPVHRPGEVVPVLLDRQFRRPLLVADFVLALPSSDRVCLLALRHRKAAEDEYRHH